VNVTIADDSEILVDARGHLCPVPTLKLRRALECAPVGARVRLLADDPMARIDVPHFAAAAGMRIESILVEGQTLNVLISKT
jgi:tRNA 2-thiouridine synthesizing protein A